MASMASRASDILDLDQAEAATAWLIAFNAKARAKGWKDDDGNGKMITDNFLAECGIAVLQKLRFIVAPEKPENMKFSAIESALERYLRPKKRLVVAERTRFHLLRQLPEETIMDFTIRLRRAAQYCEFDNLKSKDAEPTEEMMLIGLVAGLHDAKIQERVLDKIQATDGKLTVQQVQEFVQQIEERKNFMAERSNKLEDVNYVRNPTRRFRAKRDDAEIRNCKFCGKTHQIRQCPAFGKICSCCKKKNHLAAVCRSKPTHYMSDHSSEEDFGFLQANEVFSIEERTSEVFINGVRITMQIDTGASVSVISSRIWKSLGKPRLNKSMKRMESYDGRTLRTLGKFETTLEKDDRYYPAELIVIESDKSFGLIGRDLLQAEEATLSVLHASNNDEILPTMKGITASMELIEGAKNVFCRARPIPVALEEKVNAELDRLERRGIISKISGGSDNASPVVWVRKRNVN